MNITAVLYQNLNLSRADIQYIINTYENFITQCYNPFLLTQLSSTLQGVVNEDVHNAIQYVFEENKNPFKKFNSEKKRLILYKNLKLYEEPQIVELKKQSTMKL